MAAHKVLVDVHSHVYLPRYADVLRSRTSVPRILQRRAEDGGSEERLLILEHEPSGGRPVGPQYWDRDEKLKFMDKHGIDVTVVSSANPWLDFLSADEAPALAKTLNDDLEAYCASSPLLDPIASASSTPSSSSSSSKRRPRRRLYGFGLLPLVPHAPIPALLDAVSHISRLPHLRGVILGSRGVGCGLDDIALEPLWGALAEKRLVAFVHPHYGLGGGEWGARENGHVLPLALGFPFETTIAITRLILAGVLDRHPTLKLLLAHSGGTLPALSSRLASCIAHDPVVASRLKHDARYYLGQLYFDAVAYGAEELGLVSDVVARAGRYAGESPSVGTPIGDLSVTRSEGSRRMLFGTDHPFFPPLQESDKWPSVVDNLEAIDEVQGWPEADKDGVRGGNAVKLFGLSDVEL